GPGLQDAVLVWPDGAVAVTIVEFVAVAERHAFGGEEAAEEWRHAEDLVADQLEQPPDLPLRHRAKAKPGHVDQRSKIGGHDEIGSRGIGKDEAGILAWHAGLERLPVQVERAIYRFFVSLA